MADPNGYPGRSERSKLVHVNEKLGDQAERTVAFARAVYDEGETARLFGILNHAYMGSIGLPYNVAPTSQNQFVIHVFIPTTINTPHIAHACNNTPGDRLNRPWVTGAEPRDVILMSDTTLALLSQWNAYAQRPNPTQEEAEKEWKVRNDLAARIHVLTPSTQATLGRRIGCLFAEEIQGATTDPGRSLNAGEISREHCKLIFDAHSLLTVVDLGATNDTSVTYAQPIPSEAAE